MTEKDTLWIRFIEEICDRDEATLSADNYRRAITGGEEDDFEETDNAYYDFEPSPCECLEEFVLVNRDDIFD